MPNLLFGRHGRLADVLLEQLEQRTLLSWNDFPALSDLIDVSAAVVRLQTNVGHVDVELFHAAAPAAVTSFLDSVRDGDFDKTFFHRLAFNEQSQPMALHGGGFRLHGPITAGPFNGDAPATRAWEPVPVDSPGSLAFRRPNVARTLAMEGGSGRFFINLRNNPQFDAPDGGVSVFGRIATDASWSVVQAILTGSTPSDQGGEFDQLPTLNAAGFTGVNVTEEQLLTVGDAEIIKPQGVASFYTYRVYYPEGFAGSNINEFLPLGNPGAASLRYQVIARAETRDAFPEDTSDFWFRDKVISTGEIGGLRRAGVTICTFSNPANNLVPRQGKPYALEIWATAPISATLSHYDFGASAIEQFTPTPATVWTIPDVRRGADIRDFVVWSSAAETPATVTLSFYPTGGGGPIVIDATTEAFRRGGLSIGDLPQLADGGYALRIASDVPLVAAVTHFKTAGTDRGGATQLAIPGSAARAGVLPIASNGGEGSGVSDTLTFFNPGAGGTAITLIAKFSDGSPDFIWSPVALNLSAGGRASYTIEDHEALRDRMFTLLYSSAGEGVYASTLHAEHGDVTASAFVYGASTRHGFGEGFMNAERAGDDLFETLAIYNPHGSPLFSGVPLTAAVTVCFSFSDGTVVSRSMVVDSDETLIIDLTTYRPLLDQNALGRFYYSVDIECEIELVAGMSHYDTSLGGLQPSGGGLYSGTPRDVESPLTGLVGTPVWMQLRIVPQTGGFGPSTPLTTAGTVNGPVSLGTTPGTRAMRFRIDYRIQDLNLSDDIHPAGLGFTTVEVAGVGDGAGVTLSRGVLSGYENRPGPTPPPGPADPGVAGNTGDDASPLNPDERTGLAWPFRGGLIDANDNDLPPNGTIQGLAIRHILPLTLSQSDQGHIGYDDLSGHPAYPLTGDEWYPLYVFAMAADELAAGTVTFSVSIAADPNTRLAFAYFSDGDPQPRRSTFAYGASITVTIPAV